MTFTLTIFLLICLFAWLESRDPLWKILSSSYSTRWKYLGWRRARTLFFWSDSGVKGWFNHVGIDILDNGIAIYLPIFKRYIPSILIPWSDVIVGEKVYVGIFSSFKIDSMASQELFIRDKGIHLAIPYSYRIKIEEKIIIK